MKRTLLVILSFLLLTSCTKAPVNTYQAHFNTPPYITFEQTDWGMPKDGVLSALGWEESDWEETTGEMDQKDGERVFLRKNIEMYGGYVDIEFSFIVDKKVFDGEAKVNQGLVNVNIYFHDANTVAQCHKDLSDKYTIIRDSDAIKVWDDSFVMEDHPNYAAYVTKRYTLSRDTDMNLPLVSVVYYALEKDDRGIGMLFLASSDACIMNNLPPDAGVERMNPGSQDTDDLSDDSLLGEVKEFPSLWDMESDDMDSLYYSLRYDPFHVYGEDVYRLYVQGNQLLYDHINLDNLEQSTGQTLLIFGDSVDKKLQRTFAGFIAVSDDFVYQYDEQLRLQKQIPRPETPPDINYIFNDQLTQMAYSIDNSLYLLELETEAQPRLIYSQTQTPGNYEAISSINFVRDGRILVEISGWEASAVEYWLLEESGEIALELPFFVSEEHSGGYSFSSAVGAFHFHQSSKWKYADFERLALDDVGFIPFDFSGGMGMLPFNMPRNSHIWYFSEPRGDWQTPDETAFHKVDFKCATTQKLPLHVSGAKASLMAVSENRKILYHFADSGEHSFGIYTQ